MHPDATRLFALDEALRAEADAMLAASGFGTILGEAGYYPVGSYVMRTMTWRDLDFHCEREPDWRAYWEVATRFAETGWCARLQCMDAYREADYGYYLGLRAADPARQETARRDDPNVWNLDLWMARPEEFVASSRRDVWAAALTEEARSHVLAIKEVMSKEPGYRWRGRRAMVMLSVHIYEAVLERGIRDLDEFRRWWQETYAPSQA